MSTVSLTPRGPAAHRDLVSSLDKSNPYGLTPELFHANKLAPKVTLKGVYFFGAEGSDPHVCLSQWYPAPFSGPRAHQLPRSGDAAGEEVVFPTAEHYMMYHKAVAMADHETAAEILNHPHPSKSKALGRSVRNFDRAKWAVLAPTVVEQGNWLKFTQNDDLSEVLLATGDRILVEASPEDRIWGVGFNSDEAEGREHEWGKNQLGQCLMLVRAALRERVVDTDTAKS